MAISDLPPYAQKDIVRLRKHILHTDEALDSMSSKDLFRVLAAARMNKKDEAQAARATLRKEMYRRGEIRQGIHRHAS